MFSLNLSITKDYTWTRLQFLYPISYESICIAWSVCVHEMSILCLFFFLSVSMQTIPSHAAISTYVLATIQPLLNSSHSEADNYKIHVLGRTIFNHLYVM